MCYNTNDFKIEGTTLIEYTGKEKRVVVPHGITKIESKAFYYNKELIEIVFPKTLRKIEKMAFAGCAYLTDFDIPKSVISIGAYAFERCHGLKTIILPPNLNCVADNAFSECGRLTKIEISSSVRRIEEDAFCNCRELTEIIIHDGLTHIGSGAFCNCEKINNVTLPNTVTHIGPVAFMNCKNLNQIILSESTKIIGGSAFRGCKKLTNITIPQNVKKIEHGAFCEIEDAVILHCHKESVGLMYAKKNYLKYTIIGEDFSVRQEIHPEDMRICHHQKTKQILKKIPLNVADVKSGTLFNKKVDSIYLDNDETNYRNFCHLSDMRYQYILDVYDEGITNTVRTVLGVDKSYDFYQKASNVLNTLKEGGYLSEQYISSALTPQMISYTKSCAMSSYKDISINLIDGLVYLETLVKIGEDELTKVNGLIVDAVTPAITRIEKAAIVMRRILNC